MNDEIKNILSGIDGGEKVLEYINELEHHLEHHHHDDCDCGCHDHDDDEWEEVNTPYKSKLSVKEWEDLVNSDVFEKDSLILMKRMRHIAAPTSPMELADMFGYGAMYYKTEAEKLEKRLAGKLKLSDLDKDFYWSIIFDCWHNKHTDEQIFALKSELYEALGNVDLSNVKLRESEI